MFTQCLANNLKENGLQILSENYFDTISITNADVKAIQENL
jgi:hypothetical protein